nr:hypothetical protein [Spirulina subsalsa]
MSHPLYVAFIWHQHQPFYSPCSSRKNYVVPSVRQHATKDYLDLILRLEAYPQLHQTVNLVPSLILQLEAYINGEAKDEDLAFSLSDERYFSEADQRYVLSNFFRGYAPHIIAPHPRYQELYEQWHTEGEDWCLTHWQTQDYGDLMAWHDLAWIDPLFWDDPEIARWLKQGRNFTLGDRQAIWQKQREIMRQILPKHHQMQEQGQLEIITSPYAHPMLPLLADTNAAQVTQPDLALPSPAFGWPQDMGRHLRKAWAIYSDRFGRPPLGLWPPEQAVSPAILPPIAQQGFQWLCSDEAVLGWTLNHFFHRDDQGRLTNPELLYRPYRITTPHGDLAMVFRDHTLSDRIGFDYGGMPPETGARDLVQRLEAIAQQQQNQSTPDPWLVTIALDGENCWEYYPQDGGPFLNHLYAQLSQHPQFKLVTVSEFLQQFPPTVTLEAEQLHSGSWVDGNFTTWIGHPAKNRAWELLQAARQTLANHPEATPETHPEAWEALDAAEGSDWFWWLGKGNAAPYEELFEQVFLDHLKMMYQALNEPMLLE